MPDLHEGNQSFLVIPSVKEDNEDSSSSNDEEISKMFPVAIPEVQQEDVNGEVT